MYKCILVLRSAVRATFAGYAPESLCLAGRAGVNSDSAIPIPIPIPAFSDFAIPIPIPIPELTIPIPIPIPDLQFQFQFQFRSLILAIIQSIRCALITA